jgi:peptide/nickel transport system substrate-binding protein
MSIENVSRLFTETNSSLSRRGLFKRGAALASAPVLVTLLNACGGDEEDSTQTAGAATPTPESAVESTATEPQAEQTEPAATATTAAVEETESPAPTEPVDPASPTTSPDAGKSYHGVEIVPAQNEGGTIVVPSYGIYPFLGEEDVYGIAEGLTELHTQTGEPLPLLATSWEANDDATAWTFFLREGVSFHDGSPLTAEDAVYSILVMSSGKAFYAVPSLEGAEVSSPAELTVELSFSRTNVDVPVGVLAAPVYSRAASAELDIDTLEGLAEHPASTGSDPSRVVGTGPFRLVELTQGELFTVSRFDDYWGGPAHLESIIFQVIADESIIPTLLTTGEIDLSGWSWTSVDPARVPELEQAGAAIIPHFSGLYRYLDPNLDPEKTTLFQDKRVLQALVYAIDRAGLVDSILFGNGEVIDSFITLDVLWDSAAMRHGYSYDPDQAAALLDEAGWTLGANQVREQDGVPLAFAVHVVAGDPVLELTMVAIQEYWRAVGVEIELVFEDTSAFGDRLESGEFEMIAPYNSSGAYLRNLAPLFACPTGQGLANWVGYCNPEVDELMIAAASETDPEERRRITTEIMNILIDELPRIPLHYYDGLLATNPKLHNVYPNPWRLPFNIETWWLEP